MPPSLAFVLPAVFDPDEGLSDPRSCLRVRLSVMVSDPLATGKPYVVTGVPTCCSRSRAAAVRDGTAGRSPTSDPERRQLRRDLRTKRRAYRTPPARTGRRHPHAPKSLPELKHARRVRCSWRSTASRRSRHSSVRRAEPQHLYVPVLRGMTMTLRSRAGRHAGANFFGILEPKALRRIDRARARSGPDTRSSRSTTTASIGVGRGSSIAAPLPPPPLACRRPKLLGVAYELDACRRYPERLGRAPFGGSSRSRRATVLVDKDRRYRTTG